MLCDAPLETLLSTPNLPTLLWSAKQYLQYDPSVNIYIAPVPYTALSFIQSQQLFALH